MTISSNVRKVGPFTGTGTVTVFTFNFKVFQTSDLYVVKADSDGKETVLVLNSDYTATLNADQNAHPGGSITLASALATGYTMIISSTVGNLQPTDLTNQGGFYPSVITDALDRATIQIQQLQESVDRSAKLPITNDTDAAQLTADIVLLANNKAELDVLYANINDIQTVAADLNEPVSEINTVAGSITNVNIVGNDIANVNTVAGNTTNINTVAGNTANVTTVAGISGNVTTVAGISANVTAVANNATNINAVNANKTNIDAVAGNNTNITAVAGNATNINAVNANKTNIDTVAGKATEVTTVAGIAGNVTTVAGISANVTAVANNSTNINAVAGNATNINAVNANKANIDTVAGDKSNIDAVADDLTTINAVHANKTNIDAVAGNNTNITAVAGNATNINLVAGDKANIDSVAGDLTNINAVNANKANIDTVAGISSNVTTVAWISSSVVTAATNVTAINDYSKVWLGGKASDPTLRNDGSALQTGDQYFNTGTNKVRVYSTGTAVWVDSGITFSPTVERFSGTGSQTSFTLSSSPGTAMALIINISGVVQTPTVDYTVSGTTLTFTTAPPSGTNNITVQNFGSAGVINVPADGSVTTSKIVDGSVTGAKMADKAITQQKLDDSIGTSASQSEAEAGTLPNLRLFSPLRVAQAIQSISLNATYYDQSALFSGSQTSLVLPYINVIVNATLVRISGSTLNINTAGNWDNSSFATAANRAGKDFYVYALQAGGVILSANSTYPTGYTASNSRKIGGFHCLAVAVGTISGHTLSGYVAGDILPRSVWDRFNRSSARQEGTVLSSSGVWVDIYLPSVSGTTLVSVNGGAIADGASSPAFHCYKFEQWFARQGMKSISQLEFFAASQGANQSTNISGSSDPGTTSGHTDTAGRRMISNEGIEDLCGVLWQWTRDQGGNMTAASLANAYDGNDSGVGGQHYQAPYRGLLGGAWGNGVFCGSRRSHWSDSPLILSSSSSGRGVAEPANSRF